MAEAQTISAKYIFLDVVNYSFRRSVEAQTDIISTLNNLVSESIKQFNLAEEQVIYLPTGDGICIALIGVDSPYDIHIQLSLKILKRLDAYNLDTVDDTRKFKIRIGVNTNVDNLVTDINGKRNVSGAGINLAQRVMNAGDGNQVLVGDAVFETLRYREKYMRAFKSFVAEAKHGIRLPVHQLVQTRAGLDISIPAVFSTPETAEPRLSKLVAYYFAHAIKNREFLKKILHERGPGQHAYSCIVLLYMLAGDSAAASAASELKPVTSAKTWGAGKASLLEQFEHYESMDFDVISDFANLIESYHFRNHSDYFKHAEWGFDSHFVSEKGKEKLQGDYPEIWREFEFTATCREARHPRLGRVVRPPNP